MRHVALVLAALAFFLGAGIVWADSPVSLDQYRATVAQALDLATQAVAQPQAEVRQPLLARAADLLTQIQSVQLDNGTTVPVDNADLAELVKGASGKPADAQARLEALRASLVQLPRAASADDVAKLRNLLSRPPFTNDNPDLLQQLMDAIMDKIANLLGNTAQGIYDGRDWITGLGVLLLVAVLIFFIWNLRRNIVPDASNGAQAGEAHLTSVGALNRAQQFANAGDYRTAVRQLYLATLLWLDEHGRLRYDHALTNREYLQAAASEPALVSSLRPVVETFDRIWYGFESVSPEEFNAYLEQVNEVRKL